MSWVRKGFHMNISQIYIAATIVVLLVVALLVFFIRKDRQASRLTPLAGLAFGFVQAGLFFSDNRFIGYGLMGVGLVLAIIDMFTRSKSP
jgi:ABC-type cobalamin transport system permease subunit